MSRKARLVVLISGFGSNLQAIIDACQTDQLPGEVVAVISNKRDAFGLERARQVNIPAIAFPFKKEQDRLDYDRKLANLVATYQPDWVVLAGWMRLLSPTFLDAFPSRVVNLHPALPGMFPGTHAIEESYEAFKAGKIQSTGVMVHLVTDAGVDNGRLLSQQEVPILEEDTLEMLEARIHAVEHRLLVNTLKEEIEKSESEH